MNAETKLYLIPTTPEYAYEPYNHIFFIEAHSDQEAYNKAKSVLYANIPQELSEYESYNIETYNLPISPFPESEKYDILNSIFRTTKGFEHMGHFQVNWNNYTEALSNKADKENWSNETYPNNGILANYLIHTYKKLMSEKSVIRKTEYGLFNTGLHTKYYDEIYAYSSSNYNIEFLTGYELDEYGIESRPPRANYFMNPEQLVFDWHFPIDVQFDHILDDERNKQRLPQSFMEKDNKICILTGAIELMKKRVSSNYKLAIPQYYEGKIQLLLPLCLDSDKGKPNLALAVTKLDTCYQGHTCLTLDMAYNNARLIAKPESNWLIAESIEESNNEQKIYE